MEILIAEDEAMDQEFLGAALRQLGHEPLITANGQLAWDLLRRRPELPLLITDWKMPIMDGLELCRRIRQQPRPGSYMYIVVITARNSKRELLKAMAVGADDFLSKPIDTEILAARLHVAERILKLDARVRLLTQLLPVCPICGRIRARDGSWYALVEHPRKSAGTADESSPASMCPSCFLDLAEPEPGPLQG